MATTAEQSEKERASERARRFWNEEFGRGGEGAAEPVREWLISYDRWKDTLHTLLPPSPDTRILVVGTGLSELPLSLAFDGYGHVLATDISDVAIAKMSAVYSSVAAIEWATADLFGMPQIPTAGFDAVVDKATLDSVLFRQPAHSRTALAGLALTEIARVLHPGRGVYISVTPRKRFISLVPGLREWRHVSTTLFTGNRSIIQRKGQLHEREAVFVHAFTPLTPIQATKI